MLLLGAALLVIRGVYLNSVPNSVLAGIGRSIAHRGDRAGAARSIVPDGVAGAISLVFGVVILVVLRSVGLNHPDQHAPRYGLRLGLGILLLAAGAVVATRKPRRHRPHRAGLIIVVIINVLLVWLPIVFHVAAGVTTRFLVAFNGWLRAHGKVILAVVLVAAGLIMVGNGIYGLTVVR